MGNLLPISDIQPEDVLNVVRRALRSGLDADAIEDFVASVDWSGAKRQPPRIAEVLGQVEGWASQYADGDLSRAQYVGHLLSLLPAEERERSFVLGGGAVVFTMPAARRVLQPPDQSVPRPQTGSGAPPDLARGRSESGIALVV